MDKGLGIAVGYGSGVTFVRVPPRGLMWPWRRLLAKD